MDHCHQRPPKTSEDLVRDLIFAINGFHLPSNAVFGIPTAYTPLQGDPNQSDTVVRVSIPKRRYGGDTGHRWLYYRRLKLANLVALPPGGIVLATGTQFTLVSLLPQINALYGINLAAADIVDATYTVGQANPTILSAAAVSLAWEGELNLPVGPDLAASTANVDLSGFDQASLVESPNLSGLHAVLI